GGVCGGGFVLKSRNRLACFGAREKGVCTNRLTIRRDEVEARVLDALQNKLLRRELFEEFCKEFTQEMNRLRMAARASVTAMERDLARVEAEIKRLIQSIKDGIPGTVLKEEAIRLEAQNTGKPLPPIGNWNETSSPDDDYLVQTMVVAGGI